MNCENCKYPTLCKAVVIGSIVSIVTTGWYYYYKSSLKPSNEETKPSNEETTTQPDVNM
jgi:hypothetical protein